ncbi:hypothetical protein DSM3645_24580 [Blastopirellula marina DSM 3645]|uniref:DUF6924 domain-containing protein n=2 Tax=Blastopirellula marina TaxID=124 RepID=A3ZV07_9BACT|nr:hypothetical protein DSM3645_24580 [Blastopirellula marina DSM 3645]
MLTGGNNRSTTSAENPMSYANRTLAVIVTLLVGCGFPLGPMHEPNAHDPWMIRTDFSDDEKWTVVCEQVSAPQRDSIVGMDFYAYVHFKEDPQFADLGPTELIHALPDDYPGFFCFAADATTFSDDEHPILVIGFSPNSVNPKDYERTPQQTPPSDIQTLRAVPSTIQAIQNNLSIANMDFEDFTRAADPDGVFRGFSE